MNITREQLQQMSEKELRELYTYLERINQLESMDNPIFEPYRKFRGRKAILIGGSGSGKSYAAADKVLDRIMTEDDHRILCVRAQANQVTKSQFPLLVSRIKSRYNIDDFEIKKAAGQEHVVCKLNGNEILFAGLDDVEKLKSIFDITSVWIEEADQTSDKDYRELNRRLRGYKGFNKNGTPKYMQITATFNPVSVLSWLKKGFFDKKSKGQIMLHGEVPFTNCVHWSKLDYNLLNETDTLVQHTTYRDNKFIDENYDKVMQELKETDEGEYNVYGLGQWGVMGGTYFSKKSVNDRITANIQPIKQGYFEFEYKDHQIQEETIKWVDDEEGYIKIYSEPKTGHPYVLGGDTAGEGSDWNIGFVIDNSTREDIAVLKVNFDEDLYARQMYCLGRMYNDSLMAIETNFSTHPLKEVQRLGYTNIYYREEAPDTITGKYQKKYGYLTTKLTRPQALGMLRQLVREEPEKIKDLDLLNEMTMFVKNDSGRPEAMNGQHDDLVMARAICCYASTQQVDYVDVIRNKPKDIYFDDEDEEKQVIGFY